MQTSTCLLHDPTSPFHKLPSPHTSTTAAAFQLVIQPSCLQCADGRDKSNQRILIEYRIVCCVCVAQKIFLRRNQYFLTRGRQKSSACHHLPSHHVQSTVYQAITSTVKSFFLSAHNFVSPKDNNKGRANDNRKNEPEPNFHVVAARLGKTVERRRYYAQEGVMPLE